MGQVRIDGSFTIGPQSSGGDAFPGATDTLALTTTPNPKGSQVADGGNRNVISPSAFATLSGVGASDTVTHCDTLYLRCQSPMSIRLTQADPAGGSDVVSVVFVQGVLLQEFPSNGYLKLLEVKGTGIVEYRVSGQQ